MHQTILIAIDMILNRQINAIMHHPRFQALEASWRGLMYLLECKNELKNVHVRILNLNWQELSRDLMNAIDFDQSQLFKAIYTNEFDQPGGKPFGLLICDYYANPKQDKRSPNDIYVLHALTGVAAAAFSPCLIGVDPHFFNVEHLSELETLVDFTRIFEHPSYEKWKRVRQSPDARFLNLMLVRFCLRTPYTLLDDRIDHFCFQEDSFTTSHYLWGNSAYCLGAVIMRSFAQTGWFYDIKGINITSPQGGIVEKTPIQYEDDHTSFFYAKPACEVALRYEHEEALQDLGFIILSRCTYSPICAFYTCRSVYCYEHHKKKIALSLDTVLSLSRFAHYLKIIARQKIGSFATRDILENYLQQWLIQYTSNTSGELTQEFTAKYPLSAAEITVNERPDKPGDFYALFTLTPHRFHDQLSEHLCLEMSLS